MTSEVLQGLIYQNPGNDGSVVYVRSCRISIIQSSSGVSVALGLQAAMIAALGFDAVQLSPAQRSVAGALGPVGVEAPYRECYC